MPDVFSQLYIHIVFSPRNRQALIQTAWESQLYRYITGIVQGRGHKLLAIGGMPDHVHLLIGLKPSESISDLVREIKKASTAYVNQNRLSNFHFGWQNGYGVFSHSRSQIDRVGRYVRRQKEHHREKTFREEFDRMVREQGIEVGRKKSFEWFE